MRWDDRCLCSSSCFFTCSCFFVFHPSVPCIDCVHLVHVSPKQVLLSTDIMVERPHGSRSHPSESTGGTFMKSGWSAATTFLFVEKSISASEFPWDSARLASSALPNVMYIESLAAVLNASTFAQYCCRKKLSHVKKNSFILFLGQAVSSSFTNFHVRS